jgi:hypothetical protein
MTTAVRAPSAQVLARDAEPAVPGGAHAVDHRVVQLQQPPRTEAPRAHLDVPQELDPVILEHRAQVVLQRLDLLVVGGHPVAHEPVRAGEPVKDVHPDVGHG